jgi:hypothetical protein
MVNGRAKKRSSHAPILGQCAHNKITATTGIRFARLAKSGTCSGLKADPSPARSSRCQKITPACARTVSSRTNTISSSRVPRLKLRSRSEIHHECKEPLARNPKRQCSAKPRARSLEQPNRFAVIKPFASSVILMAGVQICFLGAVQKSSLERQGVASASSRPRVECRNFHAHPTGAVLDELVVTARELVGRAYRRTGSRYTDT